MMMNNRLNKLTDSLESNLNYYSRQKGKPTKHKKHQGSPLLPQQHQAPLLITSRIYSRPSTPRFHSENNSILWQDQQEEQDTEHPLVINSASSEQILIVEEEEGVKQIQVEQQLQSLNSAFQIVSQCLNTPSPKQQKNNSEKQSPIFILEEQEDQNLLWIQHQDQLQSEGLQKSRYKSEIRIEEEDDYEEYNKFYQEQLQEEQISRARLLSQIQQLQSHQEDDLQSLYNGLTTSRIPISPQTTQPFFKLQKVQLIPGGFQEQSWITKDHPEIASSQERIEQLSYRSERETSLSPESSRQDYKYINRAGIRQALKSSDFIPFEMSLKQAKRLKEDIHPRKLQSIQKLNVLIERQSKFVGEKVRQQRGTIDMLRRLLELKARAPKNLSPMETYTLNSEQQIQMNNFLLRLLAKRLRQ